MITLEFEKTEELNQLLGLLDIAQKAAGLQASQACLKYAAKISEAIQAAETESNGEAPPTNRISKKAAKAK